MAKVCIITQKEVKKGYRVEDDLVSRTIRSVKQYFKVAKNNVLVVSEEGLEEYQKKRAAYEKTVAHHAILASIVFVLVSILIPLATGLSFSSVVSFIGGAALAALIMVLPLLSHVPKIAEGELPESKKALAKGKEGFFGKMIASVANRGAKEEAAPVKKSKSRKKRHE